MGTYQPRAITEAGARKIDQVLHHEKVCLLKANTGAGKTYMTIHAVGRIAKAARRTANLLIITTVKQKNAQEFQKSIQSYCDYYHLTMNSMVTNYEQLTASRHKYDALHWLQQQPRQSTVIILDEAHKSKNPTSQRSKMIIKLSQQPSVAKLILATATPITNSLLDSMTYLILAGYYSNKTSFIRQHIRYFDDYHQPIIRRQDGYVDLKLFKQPERIIQALKQITVTIDTDKFLPKRHNNEVEFHLSDDEQTQYRQIKKNWRQGLYDSIAEALAEQRHFVAQHASQRLAYLKKIIESDRRTPGPVFIFYQYNDDLATLETFIQKSLPTYDLQVINGQTKNDFDPSKTPTNPKTIILAQYQAAGEGINAPWSHLTVFFSPAQSAEKYQQSRGRNRRAFQTGDVYQIRFIVKNTINEHYWRDLIDNKARFTHKIAQKLINYSD